MKRFEIIQKIGSKYNTSNIETGEFSYVKALKSVYKNIDNYQTTTDKRHQFVDIRFENDKLVVLVECKDKFSKWSKSEMFSQLQDYVRFEKEYSNKKIVALLAETQGDTVWTWYGQSVVIDEKYKINDKNKILTLEEYEALCFGKVNNKIKIVDSINILNEMLHACNIDEKIRSQFIGTCLLSLKNGLDYKNLKESIDAKTGLTLTAQRKILNQIEAILEGLLTKNGSINKAEKLAILCRKVLDDQDVKNLSYNDLKQILEYVENNVIPYINDKDTAGQDLLNLFFTTFNKYVGKSDKNQAFTPDHICDFMTKAIGVNRKSRVLDPCCGSGAFLVRAMTRAMDDCSTEQEREIVKRKQIYGIEYEDGAFALSSTNMLIHGDGNSNVIQDSMFNRKDWIKEKNINIVLMNPPYNARKKCCNPDYVRIWDTQSEDPSKGLHFVEWISKNVSDNCKIAVLLPMQAAIGNKEAIREYKRKLLENCTLEAVFSLPDEIFYPGASAVACCMIFDSSQSHEVANKETFFGYFKDDKFIKRKGIGRVEKSDIDGNSLWIKTENLWLDLFKNKKIVPGLSVMHKVSYEDEWLAEAYMENDYNLLTKNDFQQTLNNYISYLVKAGNWNDANFFFKSFKGNEVLSNHSKRINCDFDFSTWRKFVVKDIFACDTTIFSKQEDFQKGTIPYITRSAENNGCDSFVDASSEYITKGNCITIGAEGIFAFYQNKDFATGNKVYSLRNENLNQFNALFICTILNQDAYKYNYGRARILSKIKEEVIKLPAAQHNLPDWKFMENYIKTLTT